MPSAPRQPRLPVMALLAVALSWSAGSGAMAVANRQAALEFHVVPDVGTVPDYDEHVRRLKTFVVQPAGRASDDEQYRWIEVGDAETAKTLKTEEAHGKQWLLVSMKPQDSMDERGAAWRVLRALREADSRTGEYIVSVTLDPAGTMAFGGLTQRNVGRQVAIVLHGRVVSAPRINSPIAGGQLQITGGADGFSQAEVDSLLSTFAAGGAEVPGVTEKKWLGVPRWVVIAAAGGVVLVLVAVAIVVVVRSQRKVPESGGVPPWPR